MSAPGEEIVVTDEYKRVYDPEAGEECLVPGAIPVHIRVGGAAVR